MKVVDDTHQCNGDTGWDGDTVQIIIAPKERISLDLSGVTAFNNYGLSNLGTLSLHHIKGPDFSEAAIVRNEDTKVTIYG